MQGQVIHVKRIGHRRYRLVFEVGKKEKIIRLGLSEVAQASDCPGSY